VSQEIACLIGALFMTPEGNDVNLIMSSKKVSFCLYTKKEGVKNDGPRKI
jgi:hypothetical protein